MPLWVLLLDWETEFSMWYKHRAKFLPTMKSSPRLGRFSFLGVRQFHLTLEECMYERCDGSAYILQLKKYQESKHRVLFMCPVMRLLVLGHSLLSTLKEHCCWIYRQMLPVCCQEKHKTWAAMSDFSFVTQGPCKSLTTAVFATQLARKLGHGTRWSGSQDPSTQQSSSRALSKDIGASSSFAWMSIYAKFAKTGYSLYVPWKDEMSSHVSQCFQGVWYFKTRTDLGCHNLSSGWLITFLKFYCIL